VDLLARGGIARAGLVELQGDLSLVIEEESRLDRRGALVAIAVDRAADPLVEGVGGLLDRLQ